ncbi:MAG: hypothetical protein ACK2UO_06045 [Caldilineaceae bacterium]
MQNNSFLQTIATKERGIAFLVFCTLLVFYLITYTGVIQSSDGLAMFATAESIVRHGSIDSNQLIWMGNQQGNFAADGDLYSRKGLGMTLLAIPLIWIARLSNSAGLVHTALLLNPIITALTGALVYRAGQRLRWQRRTALVTALVFGLATLAWPYTQTFFSDPICAFGLFGGFYGLLAYAQTGNKRHLFLGGVAWGIAYLTRVANLVTLPLYLGALYVSVLHGTGLIRLRQRDRATMITLLVRRYWRPFVSFLVPVVLAGLLSLWWNWARYGSIFDSGYVETERFSANWLFGITGLLVGPARGLVWYSPALLLAIPGAVWFWRHARQTLFFTLILVIIYVLFYGKWYMWHGGYSWGPRFLVPTIPFLALLTGPALGKWLVQGTAGILGQAAVSLLLAVSVGVQWLGMLVPYHLVQDWLDAAVQPLYAPETFTRLEYSPLILQWQFLRPENISLAWYRSMQAGANVWLILLLLLLSLALAVLAVVRQTSPREAAARGYRQWVYGAGLFVVVVVLLTHYYAALTDPELRRAAARIQMNESHGEAVVLTIPKDTQAFANVYHGRLPTYGLAQQGDMDDFAQFWLERIRGTHDRVWLLPDDTLPEKSVWERTMRMEDFLLLDTRMAQPDGQRLALYTISPVEELEQVGLGTVFGDPALVDVGIDDANGWFRLRGYSLSPETRPGGELLLELYWESLQPVDENYQVFVHLLNANSEKVAQRDGQPVQWMRPTSTWQPGERITDRYGIALPPDLPGGEYTISVGLYDPVSGQRLPVSAGPTDYAIDLGPITVVADRERNF